LTDLETGAAELFDPLRPDLVQIAYRMLGSVADAEDVVQDAFLRWYAMDRSAVKSPPAFLRQVVTRLSLDVLKAARRTRELYVGPWLPEPVMAPEPPEIQDVTLPLMLALERLSPLERAAFLLHDVFGISFDEIAGILGREPAACRQLASRARLRIREGRPRFSATPEKGMEMARAFFAASRADDMSALRKLLTDDVALYADGGGVRRGALKTIVGLDAVIKVQAIIAAATASHGGSRLIRYGWINGLPGFLTEESDGLQTTAVLVEQERIAAIYVVRNPEKLKHLNGEGQS
jgi:RNA polymerase sigma-70 factor (ECF subfamily)